MSLNLFSCFGYDSVRFGIEQRQRLPESLSNRKIYTHPTLSLPPMALLAIRGVSKKFLAEGKEMETLKDIDLDIDENEFVCLIGPSG